MGRYFSRTVPLNETEVLSAVRQWAYPLESKADLGPLFDRIGDARIVMLGEASHGTHEYYQWRSYITRELIEKKKFKFIAVEGDWPDCYRLNRFIKGYETNAKGAFQILSGFNRWPTWMWANWEMVALSEWLEQYNKSQSTGNKTGFYGLDIYSLWESMENIMQYLQKTDPSALKAAEDAFRCFLPFRKNEGRDYAAASMFVPEVCQKEVVRLLKEIQTRLPLYNSDHENVFNAEQNALITVNAEKYYRTMLKGGPHSWNIRDRYMSETLTRLLDFHGADSKAVVWAHNTHIGDARGTDMTEDGMFNIGELARLDHGDNSVVLIGFGSYSGTVTAAEKWGGPIRTMQMPEAKDRSWEYLLHKAGSNNKLLLMDDFSGNDHIMEHHIGHRAIGVVYNPAYEQYGNYVPTILPLRYDAFVYLDHTHALYPLHLKPDGHQMPETYPFGV